MNTFPLTIITPDGKSFDGLAQELIVRATTGDMGILAGHANCVATLGMGRAIVVTESGERRYGACIGGMVSVIDGAVTVIATTFEWSQDIDRARALASAQRARQVLSSNSADDIAIMLAQARLRRALVRSGVSELEK